MMLTMTFGARLYGTYFTVILYTQLCSVVTLTVRGWRVLNLLHGHKHAACCNELELVYVRGHPSSHHIEAAQLHEPTTDPHPHPLACAMWSMHMYHIGPCGSNALCGSREWRDNFLKVTTSRYSNCYG
jgi:hypothetical protein